jgi:hypothetical protein
VGNFDEARTRARRRKSPWNLLLIPAALAGWGLLTWGVCITLTAFHAAIHGSQPLMSSEGVGPVLTVVGSLFAALPFALISANAVVWLVPASRKALDREADSTPGTSFRESQAGLLRLARYVSVVGGLVALVGGALPWSAR